MKSQICMDWVGKPQFKLRKARKKNLKSSNWVFDGVMFIGNVNVCGGLDNITDQNQARERFGWFEVFVFERFGVEIRL